MIDAFRLDLKQGFRRLRKNYGFTLTAVISLALGAGANMAIFQVINAVRMRSLPVPDPQELIAINILGGTRGFGISSSSMASATLPLWQEIQRRQTVLSGVFAWGANDVRFGEGADARLVHGLWLSPQAFRVLKIPAIRGRIFEGDENRCDGTGAVIGYDFWLSQFNKQDSAIGSRIVVDDRPFSIIGVMPQGFFGLEAGKRFDVAVPLCARQTADPGMNRRDLWSLNIMGRLAPPLSRAAADAQISAMSRGVFDAVAPSGYDAQAMDIWRAFRLTAVPASEGISRLRKEYESSLWILLAIAAMVLTIACSNVAGLLLVQTMSREAEFAVRLALGVTRTRLAAQLMTENLLLAICGTLGGSVLASELSPYLLALLGDTHNPIQLQLGGDWRTSAFAAALAIFTLAVLGLTPLLHTYRTDIAGVIRAAGRGGSEQSRRSKFQNMPIACQLAISLFLLVACISFVRSFRSLATVDAGFQKERLISCFADFSQLRLTPARILAFRSELLEAVRRTPGVELAAASTQIPLSGDIWTLGIKPSGQYQERSARFSWVSDSYFRTLGIPVIAGRTFTARDSSATKRVLIVNETFAKRLRERARAVGSVVTTVAEPGYPETSYEIIGVVKDSKLYSLREEISAAAFAPDQQNPDFRPWTAIVFRASSRAAGDSVAEVRRALAVRYPQIRTHFESVRTIAEDSMAREHLLAWLSSLFAALATLVTAIGIYGVTAYTVSVRRSEIAIRVVLGATSPQIAGMIIGGTARVAAVGAAAGLLFSLGAGRAARSFLFGIEPGDPLTLAAAVALLAAIVILASIWPAFRVSFVKPAGELR